MLRFRAIAFSLSKFWSWTPCIGTFIFLSNWLTLILRHTFFSLGWDRYRGGLDVHNDMTGSEAVYTLFEDHQVMFHVSTLLPYTKDDKQQVGSMQCTVMKNNKMISRKNY